MNDFMLCCLLCLCITNMGVAEEFYDLCIVGAGLFGSAAAKYASANPGIKVCLIGPDEPSPEEKKEREIFGAHYDESRLVETVESNHEIEVLSRNSVKAYEELEKLSGISFYNPVQLLRIGKNHSRWMEVGERVAAKRSYDGIIRLSSSGMLKRFPYIRIKDNEYAFQYTTGAGYINPRKMIAAQKKVAEIQGCCIINDVVSEVRDNDQGFHTIITEKNGEVKAKRVLLATGAFTNFKKFEPVPKLQITPIKETVAFLKISDKEAQRLSSMPAVYYESEDDFSAYIFPPVQYPDGNHYLKIGPLSVDFEKQAVYDLESIKQWYLSNGDWSIIRKASTFLMKMLPGLKVDNVNGAACVTCGNPSSLPYIDRISPTVTVAVVGNGRGGKICEDVGRIAAQLSITGKWDSDLPKKVFNAIPA